MSDDDLFARPALFYLPYLDTERECCGAEMTSRPHDSKGIGLASALTTGVFISRARPLCTVLFLVGISSACVAYEMKHPN